jgi:hypothetical protein
MKIFFYLIFSFALVKTSMAVDETQTPVSSSPDSSIVKSSQTQDEKNFWQRLDKYFKYEIFLFLDMDGFSRLCASSKSQKETIERHFRLKYPNSIFLYPNIGPIEGYRQAMFPVIAMKRLADFSGFGSTDGAFPYFIVRGENTEKEVKRVAKSCASLQVDSKAQLFLTEIFNYLNGYKIVRANFTCFNEYLKQAYAGFGPAQEVTALCFLHGFLCVQNRASAEKFAQDAETWFKKNKWPQPFFSVAKKIAYIKLIEELKAKPLDKEKLKTIWEKILENPYRTFIDLRTLFSELYEARLYPIAIIVGEEILRHPRADLYDKRNQSLCFYYSKKYDEAVFLMEEILKVSVKDPNSAGYLADLQRTATYYNRINNNSRLAELHKLIINHPGHTFKDKFVVAKYYFQTGNITEANRLATEVFENEDCPLSFKSELYKMRPAPKKRKRF